MKSANRYRFGELRERGAGRVLVVPAITAITKQQFCIGRLCRIRDKVLVFVALLFLIGPAIAEDVTKMEVTIKDHRFSPSEIHVPGGKPTLLTVKNEDPTAEEFDSSALKVEKVIAGGRSATVRLRPLGAGRYPFVGEYHSDTAQGAVIAE